MPIRNSLIIQLIVLILMFVASFSISAKDDDDDLYFLTDKDGQKTPKKDKMSRKQKKEKGNKR